MIQCPTCKMVLEPGVRFCPHDGTPLTETSAVSTVRTPTGGRPPSREIELPALVGERYRLTDVRGGGGMAKVYRAVDVTLEREVAVKLINPELRAEAEFDARFQREARIASQLSDPHIVVVHDFGLDPTYGPFLVMEYLQGQSLRERLQKEGPLPLKAGLQLSAQLLLALIHAHGKNIVHRDIKPDNIFLLNQSGVRLHVRVLDFGIARIYRRDDPAQGETLTSPGAVLGTPRYMSPEQLAGNPVDARSDLYSAALVIHEALTGQLPYVSGKKLNELCPEATAALQDLLDQCLRPNPMERPPSAVEVYLRLQELGKASGILLLPPGAMDKLVAARQQAAATGNETVLYTPPEQALARRRRRVLAGGALLLVLLVAALLVKGFFFSARPVPEEETLDGVKIGDALETAVDRLKLKQEHTGNPWEMKQSGRVLGHVLRRDDLGLTPEQLSRVEMRYRRDETACVLAYEGKALAVVVRHRGDGTSRGVKVGDSLATLKKHYAEESIEKTDASGNVPMVWRYDRLGVGFEFNTDSSPVIIGIALYPPKPLK